MNFIDNKNEKNNVIFSDKFKIFQIYAIFFLYFFNINKLYIDNF